MAIRCRNQKPETVWVRITYQFEVRLLWVSELHALVGTLQV